MSTARSRDVVRALTLAAIYVIVARLGLLFNPAGGFATLVWPPTGVALAALLLFGYRLWPAVTVGAFIANIWAGAPPLIALGIALGNTLEAIFGAYALRCIPGFHPSLARLRDALGLILLAAGLSTMISATLGVVTLYLGGMVSAPLLDDTWRAWWLGNMIGDLVLAPVLLTLSTVPSVVGFWKPSKRLAEAVALGAAVLLISVYVFAAPSGDVGTLEQAYVVFPLLIWAALRFGQPGVVISDFAIAAIAIAGTVSGRGPFVRPDLGESLLTLQAFLAIVSATFLTLGASASERLETLSALRTARDELEARVTSRTAELVRSNTDLQSRETQLSEAQALTHIGSWEWDVARNVVSWSDEMYRIYGLMPHGFAASYESFLERVHPDDRASADRVVQQAYRERKPFEFEHRIVRPDGAMRMLRARGRAVTDATGKLLRMAGTGQDITVEKQAEEALRRVNDELEVKVEVRSTELLAINQTLQAVVNASPVALVVADRNLKVTMWNPAAEHIFGWKADEVVGHAPPNIPEEQEEHFRQRMAKVFRGESLRGLDVRRLRKDGTVINAILSSAPLHDANDEIVGFVDAVADISDRVQLLHKLEDAVRTRDAFLSMASHELRTPLNALHLHVQILMRTGEKGLAREAEPEALARRAEVIDRQVKRLTKLIDNLLDVSRITAGRIDLELEDADLSAVVREVVTRFDDEMRRAQCQVSLRADTPVIGHWDRMRLEQVATNLLSNAVKYGAGGAIDVLVEADAWSARLIVRDHGIGIAREDQTRIFERFEQLAPGQRVGGFGLGLWIVRKIVEALGGTIAVTSEPGKGSTFVVELPKRRGTARPAEDDAERILVVEDDRDVLEAVGEILRAEGYGVVCTANGQEALQYLLDSRPPSLILLDLKMPVMDGFQFLERMKGVPKAAEVPVVLLSADGNLPRRAEDLRVAGYVQKPVKIEAILRAVERHRMA